MPNENEEIQTTTSDSIYGVNDNGEASVRIASEVTGDPTSIYGVDENGNACVRVMGSGGGSDKHNLGWYATPQALSEAHATAEAGDYAIVGSTDTVWVWDTDNSAWVDSDQKGQVSSVNNKTGAVTITSTDVLPTQTSNSGKFLTTNGTNASWSDTIKELCVKSNDSNYYSIKLKSSGSSTSGLYYTENGNDVSHFVYNTSYHQWSMKGPYSNYFIFDEIYTCLRTSSAGGILGNSSVKWDSIYVTKINNGADITVPNATGEMVVNKATGIECLTICGNVATGSYDTNVGYRSQASGNGAAFGFNAVVYDGGVACGRWAQATGHSSTAVGNMVTAGGSYSVAIGCEAKTTANYAIQISSKYGHTNADANTFKVGNDNGNFELMSANGTIPTERLTKVNSTITLASADWSSNTQTVNVTGMTATGVVMVSPDPTDQSTYTSNGILCTAQAAGTLTFTCDTVPSGDVDVNVVML